ncbi:MAG: DUF1934 domain-containing protein [Oscillospiraceae bacterium]|nr:DUF1934 domain-containing protein [Oscillospiraceae bacterium]
MTERTVLLRIRTEQRAYGEEPEVMDLQTEGTLRQFADHVELSYMESAVTDLEGVETTFFIYGDRVELVRDGEKLKNTMVFRVGKQHDSLYSVGFGALLVTVTTRKLEVDLPHGKLAAEYTVAVENNTVGTNGFTLSWRVKQD